MSNAPKRRSLFREVNDRIREVNAAFVSPSETYEVFCECEHSDCMQRVEVHAHVYEAVRHEDRFLVKPGHEQPADEHVVADESAYRVVALHPEPKPRRSQGGFGLAYDDLLPEAS